MKTYKITSELKIYNADESDTILGEVLTKEKANKMFMKIMESLKDSILGLDNQPTTVANVAEKIFNVLEEYYQGEIPAELVMFAGVVYGDLLRNSNIITNQQNGFTPN